MSDCNSCKKGLHEKDCHDTPKLIQINNNVPTLMRRVEIPASIADDRVTPPVNGQYRNTLLVYEATGNAYLFSSDGIYTKVLTDGAIDEEAKAREDADKEIWEEIEIIEASSDVVDVVGTYAELEAYDTSALHDKDLIKVLQDETHDDAITYYRWSTSTSTFSYVGAEGPYYTVSETDTLLGGKQDTLIAGTNIQIAADGKTISATDTTYTAGSHITITNDEISADYPSNFTGTDGTAAGSAGLVPAPATTDADKYLKADGTWSVVNTGPTVVQTRGTSTTDVMSQDAATKMIYPTNNNNRIAVGGASFGSNNSSKGVAINASVGDSNASTGIAIGFSDNQALMDSYGSGIAIGGGARISFGENSIAIGNAAKARSGSRGIAIGYNTTAGTYGQGHVGAIAIGGSANAGAPYSIALGANSHATTQGQFDVTAGGTVGYNNTAYRLLTGLYPGQSEHDAATVGQIQAISIQNAGAPTTATVGTVGQLLQDTTNGKLYICTAVSGSVYTWSEVGGVPVVQTTGQSTTSVMSQKAVTDIIGDVETALQILNSGSGV